MRTLLSHRTRTGSVAFAFLALLAPSVQLAHAQPGTGAGSEVLAIEVFTPGEAELAVPAGVTANHYRLDEPARVKAKYLPALPPDPTRARGLLDAFLESGEGESFKHALKLAYRGQVKVLGYQLQKVPAITFEEGRYVVYGTLDVGRAVALYESRASATDAPALGAAR